MADPVMSEGSAVEVNDGAASAYVAIDDVLQVTPPPEVVVVVDRNRVSATTLTEKWFSTRRDPGQFSFQYEHNYTKVARLNTLKAANADKGFKIKDSVTGTVVAFTGRIISNNLDQFQGGQIMTATCVVQLTSVVAVTAS